RRHTRFSRDWSSDVCSSDLFQERHRQDALRLHTIFLLQLAPDQQIELLVSPAHFEVGLERDRVVALQQRVKELVNGNRNAALERSEERRVGKERRCRWLTRQ